MFEVEVEEMAVDVVVVVEVTKATAAEVRPSVT